MLLVNSKSRTSLHPPTPSNTDIHTQIQTPPSSVEISAAYLPSLFSLLAPALPNGLGSTVVPLDQILTSRGFTYFQITDRRIYFIVFPNFIEPNYLAWRIRAQWEALSSDPIEPALIDPALEGLTVYLLPGDHPAVRYLLGLGRGPFIVVCTDGTLVDYGSFTANREFYQVQTDLSRWIFEGRILDIATGKWGFQSLSPTPR